MELTFLHLAEYANSTADQKLNVMGIFNRIFAPSFPVTHPEMYLVAQLTASRHEYGRQFQLKIKLLNEDASEEIIAFTAHIQVPQGENGLPVNMNVNFRFVNTVFNNPGAHEFSIQVDEDVKGTLLLDVAKLPIPPIQG